MLNTDGYMGWKEYKLKRREEHDPGKGEPREEGFRSYTRRKLLKTIAGLGALEVASTVYENAHPDNTAIPVEPAVIRGRSKPLRRESKPPQMPPLEKGSEYDEDKVIEYFRDGYGERAGRIASLAMRSYRDSKYGYPYDPLLFLAQIKVESGFGHPAALISPVGAGGSTQVMPGTALVEPFKVRVYIPKDYTYARAVHSGKAGTFNGIAETAFGEFRRSSGGASHAGKGVPGAPDSAVSAQVVDYVIREFNKTRRPAGESDEALRARLVAFTGDFLRKDIMRSYRQYVDNLGMLVYRGYRTGDVERMRKGMKPLIPRPESEMYEVDQRFVDEEIVPRSYVFMQGLLHRHQGSEAALSAYHAGEASIPELGGVPNIEETRVYVSSILMNFNRFANALSRSPLRRRFRSRK